jgi:ketosteroid isomerase-like protein
MRLSMMFFLLFLVSCHNHPKDANKENLKAQIVKTEQDFASLAKEKGIAEAFGFFSDSSAVIQRGNRLIEGKDSIRAFYQYRIKPGSILEWAPDFVDVSATGDLGYTYGKYMLSVPDSAGLPVKSTGIFHTVWKKQSDGSWRFVWD